MIFVTPLRRTAMAWGAVALAVFVALALTTGIPQGPEGELIAGTLQVRIQIGLLAVVAAGLLLALRWPVLGGVVIVVAAAGIGVFAAFEYHPFAAVVPFLALMIPGVLLIGGGLRGRRVVWAATAAAGLVLVLAGAGFAADRVYTYAFGPTHPESAVRLPDGPVEWIWSGAPAPTGARVTARLHDPDAPARLVVGRRADLRGPLRRVEADARGDGGAVRSFAVTGLVPGTAYHYALEVDGRIDRTRVGRLRTIPEGPAAFTVAFGACARVGSNGAVFDAIRAQDPDLYLIQGDMYYADINEGDPDRFRDQLDRALTRPAQQALYLSTRVAYMWDDHDYGSNDADATSPTRAAAQAVYREYVPHGALPAGRTRGPVYQAFTLGRVRFVLMDLRSDRTPTSEPDGPGKSMLGAAQRRWLEAEMRGARDRHELVALVSSVPWIDPARAGADDWAGFATERAGLSRFVAREGIRAVMLAGDAHMVALDDGSNADYSGTGRGGFPVIHGAALDRHGSRKGGPYSAGAFPGSGQYGTMTVRDDGRRLRVTLRGLDWEGRQLVGQTFTFAP
jgi:phosphodiesterase/alkaline phosphatase D-like protein